MQDRELASQTQVLVEKFVEKLTAIVQSTAIELLTEALAKNGATPRGRVTSQPSPERRAPRGKAPLDPIADALIAHVAAHPGQRLEVIARALGRPTSDLKVPMRTLVTRGVMRATGQARGTSYFRRGRAKA
jgi:hypothetical protein